MEDNKDIILDSGDRIPFFIPDTGKIINRSTIIYGPPETGKSTVLVDLLYRVKDQVPNIIVYTKTKSNKTFDGIIPAKCVLDESDLKIRGKSIADSIKEVIARQKRSGNTYAQINDKENLMDVCALDSNESSFSKLGNCIMTIKKRAANKLKTIINANYPYDKTESLKEQLKTYVDSVEITILKRYVTTFKKRLHAKAKKSSQKLICQYIDFDPRIVIVLEDISDVMKVLGKDPLFLDMMYNIRWYYITLLAAFHDDKLMPPGPRCASFQSIFTGEAVASAYITTTNNGFSARDRKIASKYITGIFGQNTNGGPNLNKLVYTRNPKDGRPFKYWIAKKRHANDFYAGGKAKSWSQNLWDRFNVVNKETDIQTLKVYE